LLYFTLRLAISRYEERSNIQKYNLRFIIYLSSFWILIKNLYIFVLRIGTKTFCNFLPYVMTYFEFLFVFFNLSENMFMIFTTVLLVWHSGSLFVIKKWSLDNQVGNWFLLETTVYLSLWKFNTYSVPLHIFLQWFKNIKNT